MENQVNSTVGTIEKILMHEWALAIRSAGGARRRGGELSLLTHNNKRHHVFSLVFQIFDLAPNPAGSLVHPTGAR